MNICISGYYYVGSRGDELLREIIVGDLRQFGKVKAIYCESTDYGAIDWCDVFVVGGGTLANARGIGGYKQVKYAKSRNKKIMFYANTIEAGHPAFHDYMKCADIITVRDSASHMLCQAHGYNSILAADPAVKAGSIKTIHVGLRSWVTQADDFVEKMAYALDELAHKYAVILTPYVLKDTDTISDIGFSKQVQSAMKNHIGIKAFKQHRRPDLFIGMRLHSIINRIMQLVTTIAIDYDGKVGNFMREINKDDFLVAYDAVETIPNMVKNVLMQDVVEREKNNVLAFCQLIEGL